MRILPHHVAVSFGRAASGVLVNGVVAAQAGGPDRCLGKPAGGVWARSRHRVARIRMRRVGIVGVQDREGVVDAGLGKRIGLLPGVAVVRVPGARGRIDHHGRDCDRQHEHDPDRHDECDAALVAQAREDARRAH